MLKSVRLDPDLASRLTQAAAAEGVRSSESIRRAIAKHCDDVLGVSFAARNADVIGALKLEGGRARQTGRVFTSILRGRR